MKYERFDIVLVDFPFSDLKESRKRPALVLFPLEGENDILCQITTKKRGIKKYEVSLLRSACEGNIKFHSNIYLDMLFTLHESLISRKVGSIKSKNVRNEIEEKLQSIFLGK